MNDNINIEAQLRLLSKMNIWISIIVIAILAIACEMYESKVPISNPEDSLVNRDWLGKWIWLAENDFRLYPLFGVDMQIFNEKEYVASFTEYSEEGKNIRAVSVYKVFNSEIELGQYLNVKSLRDKEDKYIFYRVEHDFRDSVYIEFLTDSLEVKFEKSRLFKDFITKEQVEEESNIWSERIVLYRRKLLRWDFLSKVDKSGEFSKFYDLGNIEEEYFIDLNREGIERLVENSKEIEIGNVQMFFGDLLLTQGRAWFWKVPNYAVIKMKSGEYIKIKYDKHGPLVIDLTNDIGYINVSEEERNF